MTALHRFRAIWAAKLLAYQASCMTGFAAGMWVYRETASFSLFSLSLIVSVLPSALVQPLMGGVVDARSKRSVLVVTKIIGGLSACIALGLLLSGQLAVWHVLAAGLIGTACNAVFLLALTAYANDNIESADLPRANSMMAVMFSLAEISAPLLGGLVFQHYGLGTALAIQIVAYPPVIVVCALLAQEPSRPHAVALRLRAAVMAGLRSGWHAIRVSADARRIVMVLIVHQSTFSFCYVLLAPRMLSRIDVDDYGILLGVGAIGALLSSIALSIWRLPLPLWTVIGLYGLVAGASGLSIGLSEDPLVWGIAIFLFYAVQPVFGVAVQTEWMRRIDRNLLGSASGVRNFFVHTSSVAALSLAPIAVTLLFAPLAESLARHQAFLAPSGHAISIACIGLVLSVAAVIAFRIAPRYKEV